MPKKDLQIKACNVELGEFSKCKHFEPNKARNMVCKWWAWTGVHFIHDRCKRPEVIGNA